MSATEVTADMRSIAASLMTGLFLTGLVAGCNGDNPARQFPAHLMVSYSANTTGSLFPCGCRIPLGGLSRRGGVLAQESPYPQLILDAGSFAGGNTGYDRFTAGWVLKAYALMGYQAVNLGIRESVQPLSQIREWDAESGGMLVSANLLDEMDMPATRTKLIREIGGIRIGITGMTMQGIQPIGATGMGRVVQPIPPLHAVMEEFDREGVDFAVLLADMGFEDIRAIVAQVPGFDLVIQGTDLVPSAGVPSTVLEDGTRLVAMGGAGKYLGRMRLDFTPDGTITGEEVMRVELNGTVPTLSSISALLTEYKLEMIERRTEFLQDPTNPFQRPQSPELVDVLTGYVGASFCDECHLAIRGEPAYVRHSTAWGILVGQQRADPGCLACHTTGWGVPTGMEDPYRDSHLTGVTCEACHGPAAGHVREQKIQREHLDPSSLLPYQDSTGVPFSREVPEAVCKKCHTEQWSPDFDYTTWLERVRHPEPIGPRRIYDAETGELITPDLPEGLELPSPE